MEPIMIFPIDPFTVGKHGDVFCGRSLGGGKKFHLATSLTLVSKDC